MARVHGFLEGRKVSPELAEVSLEAIEVVERRTRAGAGTGRGKRGQDVSDVGHALILAGGGAYRYNLPRTVRSTVHPARL